jgi:AcrR family transcriptional regulator
VSAAAEPQRHYRGQTLSDRRAAQLQRLLRAGCDVFARTGYANAGIDEIVARAHASRSTFYLFFANKEDCLLAVFQWGLERVAGEVTATVAATAGQAIDPTERVREEVRATARALAADPAMARVLLIEIVGATPAAEEARTAARNGAAAIIEQQLALYPHWRRRTSHQRHIASLAAMAAIGEPIAELAATGRMDGWESLVDPITEFVARALIPRLDA